MEGRRQLSALQRYCLAILAMGFYQPRYPKLCKRGWEQAREMGGERETVLGLCQPFSSFFFFLFWRGLPSINPSSLIPHLLHKHPVSNTAKPGKCIKWLTLIVQSSRAKPALSALQSSYRPSYRLILTTTHETDTAGNSKAHRG